MENRDIGQEVNLILASNSQFQDPHISIKFFLGSGKLTLWLCPELAQNSSGSTTGTYRRLRPLSTRRFGQPRRLGSRRASSPSGARAGGLSVKACACSPAPLPALLLPSFCRALPLTSWSCSSCPSKEVYSHDGEAFWVHFRYFARGLSSKHFAKLQKKHPAPPPAQTSCVQLTVILVICQEKTLCSE